VMGLGGLNKRLRPVSIHLPPSGLNPPPQAQPVEALSRRDTPVDGQKRSYVALATNHSL
jgi:hypothetical protein